MKGVPLPKCVFCEKPYKLFITMPKGLSMTMFGILNGKVPVCRGCRSEVGTQVKYAL